METSWRFLGISLSAGLGFLFDCPGTTGDGLLRACWKVLRIAEARGFSTAPHVVWPVCVILSSNTIDPVLPKKPLMRGFNAWL